MSSKDDLNKLKVQLEDLRKLDLEKDKEISKLTDQNKSKQNEIDKLKKMLDDKTPPDIKKKEEELELKYKEEREKLKQKVNDLELKVYNLNDEKTEQLKQIKKLQEELESKGGSNINGNSGQDNDNLKEDAFRSKEELASLRGENAMMRSEITRLKQNVESLQNELENYKKYKEEKDQLEKSLESNKNNTDKDKELGELRNKLDEIKMQNENLIKANEILKKGNKENEDKIKEYGHDMVERNGQIDKYKEDILKLRAKLSEAENIILQQKDEHFKDLENQRNLKKEEKREIEKLKDFYNKELENLREKNQNELNKKDKTIKKLNEDNAKLQSDYCNKVREYENKIKSVYDTERKAKTAKCDMENIVLKQEEKLSALNSKAHTLENLLRSKNSELKQSEIYTKELVNIINTQKIEISNIKNKQKEENNSEFASLRAEIEKLKGLIEIKDNNIITLQKVHKNLQDKYLKQSREKRIKEAEDLLNNAKRMRQLKLEREEYEKLLNFKYTSKNSTNNNTVNNTIEVNKQSVKNPNPNLSMDMNIGKKTKSIKKKDNKKSAKNIRAKNESYLPRINNSINKNINDSKEIVEKINNGENHGSKNNNINNKKYDKIEVDKNQDNGGRNQLNSQVKKIIEEF